MDIEVLGNITIIKQTKQENDNKRRQDYAERGQKRA